MKTLAGFGVTPAEQAAAGGLSGGPLRARVRIRGENAGGAKEGTPEIYFGDPDGITIQLQAPTYCGGAGLLGEVCSSPKPAGKPPLVTREMNHVTLAVAMPTLRLSSISACSACRSSPGRPPFPSCASAADPASSP